MSRNTKKTFKIFCEGDTEYNYFEGFRKSKRLSLALRSVNMFGGGYSSFLKELKTDGNSNCLAKFIVIDGDRAFSVDEEYNNLDKLINYCITQNDSGRIPHILIIDYPDFEYVACLHSPKFKGSDYKRFIKNEFHYKDIEDFKADKKVYDKLNKKGNSYDIMLKNLLGKKTIISNRITVKKSKFHIKVEDVEKDLTLLGKNGSNIYELFNVLKEFGEAI